MIFKPMNNDIEYYGIDILKECIISQKIYYRVNTAKQNVFDKYVSSLEGAAKLKLFDYSVDKKKESFGYLILEKQISSLLKKTELIKFYDKNHKIIYFADEINEKFLCYPPVLGIKYNSKVIEAIGVYTNPPIEPKNYIENYMFIRNNFPYVIQNFNYSVLFNEILDDMVFNKECYLFLFGFDITEQGAKKYKFYIKLEKETCIKKIYELLKDKYAFDSEFLLECFYTIPKDNNCFVDIVAFSFLDSKICLNIYYKQKIRVII